MTYKPKILQLITEPNTKLHIASQNISEINTDIQNLMLDMLHTMYHHDGIGLAAVQVGIHLNVIVIDIDYTRNEDFLHFQKPIFMINARIIDFSSNTIDFFEGCLSLPNIRAKITRNEQITVEYLNYNGNLETQTFNGLLAICIQHEIDHTKGFVFIDRLSKFKKDFFMKKLYKQHKNNS